MCIKGIYNKTTFIKNTFQFHGKCQQCKTSIYFCTNLTDEKIVSMDKNLLTEEKLTKEI